MTDITNLYLMYQYPKGQTNLPILIVVHGWSGNATTPGMNLLRRCADAGVFVASVGLRGRNGATGANDACRREIHDIYDAVQWIRSNFSSVVSPTLAGILGYSDGGAAGLACACKFPDLFAAICDFFGISDFGVDGTNGWYYNGGGTYPAELRTVMGGDPTEVPDHYKSNDATSAILNYSGGHIYIYHDTGDTSVPSVHSTRIKNVLDGASRTNYTLTTSVDGTYAHAGTPDTNANLITPEMAFVTALKAASAWTIPTSGTITVIGYIVTKRFTIWLGTGMNTAATVVYNTGTGVYTVTPTTSATIAVSITQGALTASGNAPAGEATEFTVT